MAAQRMRPLFVICRWLSILRRSGTTLCSGYAGYSGYALYYGIAAKMFGYSDP